MLSLCVLSICVPQGRIRACCRIRSEAMNCRMISGAQSATLELKDTTSPIKYDKEATGQLKRTQTFQGFIANPMDLGDFPFVSFVAAAY